MNSQSSVRASSDKKSIFTPPQRLLIVRLGAMGDIIHTLPAVAALRSAFPQTIFGWIVEERWADLLSVTVQQGGFSPHHWWTEFIPSIRSSGGKQFCSQTWNEIASSVRDFRAPRYEVAIDFQGAIRSSFLSRWSGAPRIYGFAHPRESPARILYTDVVAGERRTHYRTKFFSCRGGCRASTHHSRGRVSHQLPCRQDNLIYC